MSIQSRQHGGLCVGGHPGRILGCPYNPDSMEGCVWVDIQGGSWDVHTIQTAWGLRVGGHPGKILGCPWDPPDSMDTCRQHWTALAFQQSLVNDSTANTAYIYRGSLWGQTCCSVIDSYASSTSIRIPTGQESHYRCISATQSFQLTYDTTHFRLAT